MGYAAKLTSTLKMLLPNIGNIVHLYSVRRFKNLFKNSINVKTGIKLAFVGSMQILANCGYQESKAA